MPRYYPNSRFSDGWSSVGDVTFYHRNGKCFFRKKAVCAFAGTAEQLVQSDIHRRALAAWQGLAHNVQEVWNLIARDAQPHRPPFGTDSHISGFNLFVSAYHGFARLGTERIPEPRVWEDFPSFFIDNFSVSSFSRGENSIILVCRLHLPSGVDASRYRLVGKIQFVPEGKGSNPGLMRTFLAEDVESMGRSVKVCKFVVPGSVVGSRVQLHSRMLLLDSSSGYRSQYQKYSQVL